MMDRVFAAFGQLVMALCGIKCILIEPAGNRGPDWRIAAVVQFRWTQTIA